MEKQGKSELGPVRCAQILRMAALALLAIVFFCARGEVYGAEANAKVQTNGIDQAGGSAQSENPVKLENPAKTEKPEKLKESGNTSTTDNKRYAEPYRDEDPSIHFGGNFSIRARTSGSGR